MYLRRVFYDTESGDVFLYYVQTQGVYRTGAEEDIAGSSIMSVLPRQRIGILEWNEPDEMDEEFTTQRAAYVKEGKIVFLPFEV